MKRYRITVNGQSYDVAVEEMGGQFAPAASAPAIVPAASVAAAAPSAPAPTAPAPAVPSLTAVAGASAGASASDVAPEVVSG
ncbi:MAG: hypothetical protein Q8M76_16240, partial [Spirochaetaceae bacterium]|nr:hypothetical protein [Spirochaetaceae bacterium]